MTCAYRDQENRHQTLQRAAHPRVRLAWHGAALRAGAAQRAAAGPRLEGEANTLVQRTAVASAADSTAAAAAASLAAPGRAHASTSRSGRTAAASAAASTPIRRLHPGSPGMALGLPRRQNNTTG